MKRPNLHYLLRNYDPTVGKPVLVLLAGILWFGVGVMLSSLAAGWLIQDGEASDWWFAGLGFLLAMPIHHFGFLRIVDKNLGRIKQIDGKYCAFGFMPWKSYILIPVMMTMGILLRHSAFPKTLLSIIYFGLGISLILSSIRYFRNILSI